MPGDDNPLSAQNIEIIQSSWKGVKAIGLQDAGVVLFMRIFTVAPAALQLFSFKDVEAEYLYTHPRFKRHALKVTSTVDAAVGLLNDLDTLVPILKDLGKRHQGYGVVDAHYDVVGGALLETLENAFAYSSMGPFDAKMKAAWAGVFGVIKSTMLAGAGEA